MLWFDVGPDAGAGQAHVRAYSLPQIQFFSIICRFCHFSASVPAIRKIKKVFHRRGRDRAPGPGAPPQVWAAVGDEVVVWGWE